MLSFILPLSLLAFTTTSALAQVNCSSAAIPYPKVFGVNVTSLTAQPTPNFGGVPGNNVCVVTVAITHPGTGDSVNNYIALPITGWNRRFQGVGGGGWAAGNPPELIRQTALGYAAATTDAGHVLSQAAAQDASPWALASTGNVNQYGLYNFARRSLHDMTVIGKAVSESFYGKKIYKSYWNGCSTGGRQGLMFAQYYPTDYDGILAKAPAIQWTSLLVLGEYIWSVMTNENYYPPYCELQAVVDAVTAACDDLDGVHDGIISAPGLCRFDAQTLVGQNFTCATDGSQRTFVQKTADVANKIWKGPQTPDGEFLWYGLIRGANFTALYTDETTGLAAATPRPLKISDSWIKGFIKKDLSFNTNNLTYAEYPDLFLQSHLEYDSIIGTANPNLRPFKKHGGKMITWQGLADQLVPPQQTILYYQGVSDYDPRVQDFYRLFFSPGVGHCDGGIGPQPIDPLAQLRAWVENGTAPATLKAGSQYPANSKSSAPTNGTNVRFLDLCPYPKVNKFQGGDSALASSYSCEDEDGWEHFPGPEGDDWNYYVDPGWYGGDSPQTTWVKARRM